MLECLLIYCAPFWTIAARNVWAMRGKSWLFMSKRLRKYLEAIASDRPVSLNALLIEAQRLGVARDFLTAGLASERYRGDLYRLSFTDVALRQTLQALSLKDDATRVDAALTGRSHSIAVEGSYLLRRTLGRHPEVVLFDSEGNTSPTGSKKQALIIENRQNFLSIERCLDGVAAHCSLLVTENFDIIFGAGREITNHLHTRYLAGFDDLYLLFDLDEGGLSIAKILADHLPSVHLHFLIPADAAVRLQGQARRASQKTIDAVYRLAMDCPMLAPAAGLIMDSRKTLEQESYLI